MSDIIMDGVWIINVNPAGKPYNMVACAVAGMILFGLAALFANSLADGFNRKERIVFNTVTVVFGVIAGLFVGVVHNQYLNPVTYDIIIGDNVSFNDFAEQYEIIEQNGNIYTVKERTK